MQRNALHSRFGALVGLIPAWKAGFRPKSNVTALIQGDLRNVGAMLPQRWRGSRAGGSKATARPTGEGAAVR
jgi:hypothetical protein